MKYILTFATQYNGVCCNLTDDNIDPTDEMYSVFDDIGDTFPEYTYEMVDKFDHELTPKQERKLCKKAEKLLKKVDLFPEVEFEYDYISS